MRFKKGDIIETISSNKKNKRKRMYIIVSVKEDKGVYITSRIEIALNEKEKMKWHYNLENNNDILLIRYDCFSFFEESNVVQSDYKLNVNPINLIRKLYELKEETKEERKQERRETYKRMKQQKQEKNKIAKACRKGVVRQSPAQMKGIHDSIYKGKITIVRG